MNTSQKKNIIEIQKVILLKIKIPCYNYFSCSKVFCSKVKLTIEYYRLLLIVFHSKFSLGIAENGCK